MLTGPIRRQIKRGLPKEFLRWYKCRKWEPIRQQYAALDVAEAFVKIYRTKLWGAIEGEEFFSGRGSGPRFSLPYVDWVQRFIAEHQIRTVVDLGCGDFQVGRLICAGSAVRYVGADVVPDLVAYNQSRFGGPQVEFRLANIIEDEPPDGELCLIREVLQHLSNAQIQQVLARCAKYPYVLVTEGQFVGRGVKPNLDITHGPDFRVSFKSGVFLDLPPFNLKTKTVLDVHYREDESVIRTMLVEGLEKLRKSPAEQR